MVILGFGLYRGVNSNVYLSAYAFVKAPFMFVPDLFFNVVVACSIIVCSAVAVTLAWTGRLKANTMPYVLPTALLLAGNLAALLGVILSLPPDLALLVPGLLYGAGSVMLSLFWIEVLSVLSPLPGDVQMRSSCVLLLVSGLCAWFVRRRLRAASCEVETHNERPIAETVSAEPAEALSSKTSLRARWGAYRDAFLELGDSLVAFFVLEAVIGLLNSFMLAGSIDFEGSGAVSAAAIVGAIVVFCFIVFVAHRIPKVSTVSRVVMPVLAAMLVFLPFLSERYNLVFSMLLLGSYYFVALLITYLIAEAAQTRKVSPYVLMGVAMGVARVCLAVALLSGYAAGVAGGGPGDEAEHTMRYLVIIVVVLYALCMALVFFSRDRKRRRAEEASADAPNESAVGTDSVSVPEIDSTLDACCASVAREGGLTEREAEILVYLARGRTKAYIADALFVTENTVRSHVRNIYSKLDVHTRQELLDLLER